MNRKGTGKLAFIRGPIPHFIAIRNRKGDDDDDDNDDDDNADNDDNDADNDDDNADNDDDDDDIVNSVIFTNHSL